MSGGLAFEGLNNASATPNNLLIILNDNNMAIDRSVGGMKQYLLNLQMSEGYNRIRYKISQMFHRWGILNEERRKSLIRFNNSLKSMLVQQQNVFEGMNIRYFHHLACSGHIRQGNRRAYRCRYQRNAPFVSGCFWKYPIGTGPNK